MSQTQRTRRGTTMANMIDVAKYILEQCGEMSAMKLQKLMYYSQAWHLVWAERPLFEDEFQAWANGPVLPTLYARHRGQFSVSPNLFLTANAKALTQDEAENVDKVLSFYGAQSAQWLSNLTHQEAPWILARGPLQPGASSEAVIDKASIHEYYSGL